MKNIIIKEINRASKNLLLKYANNHSDFIQAELEVPKSREFGDLSSNIAFILSKKLKRSPFELANEIVSDIILPEELVNKIVVVHPGFINLFLDINYYSKIIENIFYQSQFYGATNLGNGKKIILEFVSANPTGPLHIGHGRCAALGDSLSNLLEFVGYSITKEFYINNTGKQITLLGESIFARYKENLGGISDFPDDGYKGDYIKEIAQQLINDNGSIYLSWPHDRVVDYFSKFAMDLILKKITHDLKLFGIHFDSWFPESSLFENDTILLVINTLCKKGLIYEQDGAKWMKASIFGDQKDRVVVRSNGETTYFASDIAYHEIKYQRGFDILINIWGADHHGYIDRIKAILLALDHPEDSLKILLVQMVKIVKDGLQIDMSKRMGTFTTLEEVINEVGKDAARFFFLLRRHDSHLDFDIDLAKKQSSDNPVFYCQYAHARICSVEKKARELKINLPDSSFNSYLSLLTLDDEREIIKKLDTFPDIIKASATTLEPHKIAFFLIELSTIFHQYYNTHKIITFDNSLTIARIILIKAIKIVIVNCLTLLGINAPEKM